MDSVTPNRYPFQKSRRWQWVKFCDLIFDRFQKHHSSKAFPEKVQKILAVRLDHIGDLVCSLPAMTQLKESFPGAQITVLTGSEGEAIFKENPFVNELIVFRSNWFSRSKGFNLFELIQVLFRLRKAKFDLGYDLRGDLRNIMLMALSGVKFRIGYDIAGGRGLLHRVGEYDGQLHQAELNMKLITNKISARQNLSPKIYLSLPEREEAKRILREAGVQSKDRLIAVHPEAGYPSKEWDEKNLKEFIELLIRDKKNKVLILGLSKAKKIAAHFQSSSQVIDLAGTLSLRQMIAVIGECCAFIGNDSGPSHIAQALSVPALVIASGTNEYDQWGIWRQPSQILSNPVSCAPCHLRACNVDGHPCMSQISSEQAFDALKELVAV